MNIIQAFLDRTKMSAYGLAKELDVNRSTISQWLKDGPRYPRLTELALRSFEPVQDPAQDVEPDPAHVVTFQGNEFRREGEYYIGCDRKVTRELIEEAFHDQQSDAYAALNNIAAEYMSKKKRNGEREDDRVGQFITDYKECDKKLKRENLGNKLMSLKK